MTDSVNFGDLIRPDVPHDALKKLVASWFSALRDRICKIYEQIENEGVKGNSQILDGRKTPGKFETTSWDRPQGGHGEIFMMRNGRVFEKLGITVLSIWGEFSPEFRLLVPGADEDPRFFVTSVIVSAHMCNPNVPEAHFHSQMVITSKGWFGGGGDIIPTFPDSAESKEDAELFLSYFKNACDKHNPEYFARYQKWCEEYFYMRHRNESEKGSGIFYDWLRSANPSDDFAFTRDVGEAWLEAHPALIRKRMFTSWTPEQRQAQLVRRGQYVEHSLLYNKAIVFGIRNAVNADTLMLSMPPLAAWP